MAKKQFNVHTELTARIDDLTSKLNTANQRVNHFKKEAKKNKGEGQIFDNLLKGASKFLPAIGAAAAAQQVFQGTIKTTQAAGDSWDLTAATMRGTLEGFYRTLGTGDWSNFLNNLLESGAAARELTAELDELFEKNISAKLNNSEIDIEIAKLNKELRIANARGDNELVIELETKIIAKADEKFNNDLKVTQDTLNAFAKNINAITRVSYEEIQTFLRNYNSETSEKIRSEIDEYNKTIEEYQRKIASFDIAIASPYNSSQYKDEIREKKRLEEEKLAIFRESLSTQAKIYKATEEAYNRTNDETIESAINAQLEIQQITVQRINQTGRAEVAAATAKKRLNDEEIKQLKEKLNLLAKTAPKELSISDYQVEEFDLGEIKYGGLKGLTDKLSELRKAQELAASPEIWQEYQAQITALEEQINNFKGVSIDNNNGINDQIEKQIDLLNQEAQAIHQVRGAFSAAADISELFGSETTSSIFKLADVMGQMALAINAIEAAKLSQNVATNQATSAKMSEAAATNVNTLAIQGETAATVINTTAKSGEVVASTAATSAKSGEAIAGAAAEGTKMPFPTNLIAIAAGVGAVLSALSSIPKFAVGGVVGGNSFTGDKILAGLNTGERILTAEQNKIFENLTKNEVGVGGVFRVEIEGDKLVGVLNNYNKRKNSYR